MADTYGRKVIYRTGMILTGVCLGFVYLSSSIDSMIIIILLIGALTSVRITISYVYMSEFITQKHQSTVGTIWQVVDSLVFLIITVYFDKVSKYWMPISFVGLAQIILCVIRSFWTHESPKFLIT